MLKMEGIVTVIGGKAITYLLTPDGGRRTVLSVIDRSEPRRFFPVSGRT